MVEFRLQVNGRASDMSTAAFVEPGQLSSRLFDACPSPRGRADCRRPETHELDATTPVARLRVFLEG